MSIVRPTVVVDEDHLRALRSSAKNLADLSDMMLIGLCRELGKSREDFIGLPALVDLAIKRMREVLL